jgi:hypothetical protein
MIQRQGIGSLRDVTHMKQQTLVQETRIIDFLEDEIPNGTPLLGLFRPEGIETLLLDLAVVWGHV